MKVLEREGYAYSPQDGNEEWTVHKDTRNYSFVKGVKTSVYKYNPSVAEESDREDNQSDSGAD